MFFITLSFYHYHYHYHSIILYSIIQLNRKTAWMIKQFFDLIFLKIFQFRSEEKKRWKIRLFSLNFFWREHFFHMFEGWNIYQKRNFSWKKNTDILTGYKKRNWILLNILWTFWDCLNIENVKPQSDSNNGTTRYIIDNIYSCIQNVH